MATATEAPSGAKIDYIQTQERDIQAKKRDTTNSAIYAVVFLALSYVSYVFSMPIFSVVLCFLGCTSIFTFARCNSEKQILEQELYLAKIESGVHVT